MNNFNFYNPTQIVFGKDRLGELDSFVPINAKVLILFGGGSVNKFGTLDKVKKALASRTIVEFGGIEPNPQFDTLIKAVEIVKTQQIDFLLAVGGGSVMDGSKFISLASDYNGDLLDLFFKPNAIPSIKNPTPFGTVATLPATGSEMNNGAVISHNGAKHVIGSPLTFPKFSFLDPTLTFTLPAIQVANGVVDTFIHVVEQYVTYDVDGRFQDRTAEGILKTLIEIGHKTVNNPTDYDFRANLVWCATNGLNGLIGAGVPQDWTTHMIGHELTAMFHIDHAQTLAILQPSIWKVRKSNKHAKLLQYARRVWNIKCDDPSEAIDLAIEKTREFFESLGIKTRLGDYGVTADKIEDVVNALEKHGRTALCETNDLTLDISKQILKISL